MDATLEANKQMSEAADRVTEEINSVNMHFSDLVVQNSNLMRQKYDLLEQCHHEREELMMKHEDTLHLAIAEKDFQIDSLNHELVLLNEQKHSLQLDFDQKAADLGFFVDDLSKLQFELQAALDELEQLRPEADGLKHHNEILDDDIRSCQFDTHVTVVALGHVMDSSNRFEHDLRMAKMEFQPLEEFLQTCQDDHSVCMEEKYKAEVHHDTAVTERDEMLERQQAHKWEKEAIRFELQHVMTEWSRLLNEAEDAQGEINMLTEHKQDLQLEIDQARLELENCETTNNNKMFNVNLAIDTKRKKA